MKVTAPYEAIALLVPAERGPKPLVAPHTVHEFLEGNVLLEVPVVPPCNPYEVEEDNDQSGNDDEGPQVVVEFSDGHGMLLVRDRDGRGDPKTSPSCVRPTSAA